jgi:hypothetical protein
MKRFRKGMQQGGQPVVCKHPSTCFTLKIHFQPED